MKTILLLLAILTCFPRANAAKIRGEVIQSGTGVSADWLLFTDQGGGLAPSIKFDATLGQWQWCNDGVNCTSFASFPNAVMGPASSFDNSIARYDGTTGKLLQNSNSQISDIGDMSTRSITTTAESRLHNTFVNDTAIIGVNNPLYLTTQGGTYSVISNQNFEMAKHQVHPPTTDTTTGSNATLVLPTTKYRRITGALVSVDMIPAVANAEIVYVNEHSSAVTFNHETGATAANRIKTPNGLAAVVQPGATISLWYSSAQSRWLVTNKADILIYRSNVATGSLYHPGSGSCQWERQGSVSATMGPFAADTDCGAPTVVNSTLIDAPSTKIPAFVIKANNALTYDVLISGGIRQAGSTTIAACHWQLSDGTNTYPLGQTRVRQDGGTNTQSTFPALVGRIELSSALGTPTTFQLQALPVSTTDSCIIENTATATAGNLKFSITAYKPEDTTNAVVSTRESQNFYLQANGAFAAATVNYGTPTSTGDTILTHSAGVYTATKKCMVTINASGRIPSAVATLMRVRKGSTDLNIDQTNVANSFASASATVILEVGETVSAINTSGALDGVYINVTATTL